MKKGFTLIEILIAVAIIAILTAIGIVSYTSINRRARDAKRVGDIEQIRSGLEMYRSDNGFYPAINTSGFDVASNLAAPLSVSNTYLPSIPADPQSSQHTYYFEVTSQDMTVGNYYGYCICGWMESQSGTVSSCADTLPATCNYGVRQP